MLYIWPKALDDYRRDCGKYPSESEGLNALLANPGVSNWRGPYIEGKDIGLDPKDGWGTRLRYQLNQAGPGIVSAGADRIFGTQDDITASNKVPEDTARKLADPQH